MYPRGRYYVVHYNCVWTSLQAFHFSDLGELSLCRQK
jgi:hypothetical protein